MAPTKETVYEFGEFVLDPYLRVLNHFGNPVALAGKAFDILLYLLEHPNELITSRDLTRAVWGEAAPIHETNVPTYIAKIRKALGCDSGHPTFIKTYHGRKAYRFISEVKQIDRDDESFDEVDSPGMFAMTSHLFVPIYCGRNTYKKLPGGIKQSQWASYKEFAIDNGRLCVLPNGVGVWHLLGKHKFDTLSDVARWRKETYDKILDGEHRIAHYRALCDELSESEGRLFGVTWQRPSYIFSFLVVDRSPLRSETQIHRLLEILSCLTPLEPTVAKHSSADGASNKKIVQTPSIGDAIQFGTPDADVGFVSWDSLSYHPYFKDSANASDNIVELEIALQATWWLAKSLNTMLLAGEVDKADLRDSMSDLTRLYARLQTIGTTESPNLLRMSDAVLSTSRIEKLVNETFRLFDNL